MDYGGKSTIALGESPLVRFPRFSADKFSVSIGLESDYASFTLPKTQHRLKQPALRTSVVLTPPRLSLIPCNV